jgi:hypothetical protein
MTKNEAVGFTFKKRLGVVTNLDKSTFPGVYIAGKYWWSKGAKKVNDDGTITYGRPIVTVMPDQWEEDFLPGENMQPLPPGVTVAIGPYEEMIVLKS